MSEFAKFVSESDLIQLGIFGFGGGENGTFFELVSDIQRASRSKIRGSEYAALCTSPLVRSDLSLRNTRGAKPRESI